MHWLAHSPTLIAFRNFMDLVVWPTVFVVYLVRKKRAS